MKEITTKLYEFSELSEEARERAIDDASDNGSISDAYWEMLLDTECAILITKEEMELLTDVINHNEVMETGNGDGSYCTSFGTIMYNEDIVTNYRLEERAREVVFAIEDKDYILEGLEIRIIKTFLEPALGYVDREYLENELSENDYWFDINGKVHVE